MPVSQLDSTRQRTVFKHYSIAMDKDFWHDRWQRNEIGFHRETVHPALEKHWSSVCSGNRGPVLVPLCGKSLDMLWLARRGHPVAGVELDRGAVDRFFGEAGLTPAVDETGALPAWSADNVTIFVGDFFEFDHPGRYGLVYDRAALIALPPEMRPRYLAHLARQLAPSAGGLLITLEYPPDGMQGPPFPVMPDELAAHPALGFECLERSDALAAHTRFSDNGLAWLNETVYALTRR